MTEYVTIEVFVCLNENGEYVASSDEESCHDEFNSEFDGHERRSYKFNIDIPLPKTETVSVTLPEGQKTPHLKLVT